MADLRTLREIGPRTPLLQVACSRCDRRGRHWLDTLITHHGPDAGGQAHCLLAQGQAFGI